MISQSFIDGFAGVCMDVGLTEKQASILLEVASVLLDAHNPDYAKGFANTIKQAGFLDTTPDLTGAFSAPDSTIAKGTTGFGLGALAGGALGLASILKPSIGRHAGGLLMKLQHNGKPMFNLGAARRFTPQLDRAALRAALPQGVQVGQRAVMDVPIVPKYESRLRTYARRLMGPNMSRLVGGAAAGGAVGAPLNAHYGWFSGYGKNVPTMDHWLPDVLSADTPSAPGQGAAGAPSMLDPLPSFHTPVGGTFGNAGGSQAGQNGPTQIDRDMAALQSQLRPPGSPEAALHNNRIRRQLADLERARVRQYSDAAIAGGAHRSSMAAAGSSIADKLKDVEKAISDREQRAGNAGAWLERSGGPTTLGKMLPQAWNSLVGNEAGLRQITAELQQLYQARNILNRQLAASGQNM